MFEFPLVITLEHQATATISGLKVQGLPDTDAQTVNWPCDIQAKTPGAIFQEFGMEVTNGVVIYAPHTEYDTIQIGDRFTWHSIVYAVTTKAATRFDGLGLDYVKALAVAVNG